MPDFPPPSAPARTVPVWRRHGALLAAGALVLLRLAYLPWINLFPEEAYYWNYSRHLDFGYLDHPPLVAWLIRLGEAGFGHGESGVRCLAPVCSLVTAFFVFRLASLLYGRRAGWAAVWLVQVLPFFFMVGWLMTPDAPLTACWAGTLFFLARVVFDGHARAWVGVGVCLGVGMLSKYTIALLGPAALLFLALDPPSRVWFRRASPYAAVLLAAAIFSPVIAWNALHHWASFAFQSTGRLHESRRFALPSLAGSVLLMLTPMGVILAGRVLFARGDDPPPGTSPPPLRAGFHPRAAVGVRALQPDAPRQAQLDGAALAGGRARTRRAGGVVGGGRARCPRLADRLAADGGGARRGIRRAAAIPVRGVAGRSLREQHRAASGRLARDDARSRTKKTRVAAGRSGPGVDRRDGPRFHRQRGGVLPIGPDPRGAGNDGVHLFGGHSLMYAYWFPAREQDGATLLLVGFKRNELRTAEIRRRSGSLGPIEERSVQVGGRRVRAYYTRVAYGYLSGGYHRSK